MTEQSRNPLFYPLTDKEIFILREKLLTEAFELQATDKTHFIAAGSGFNTDWIPSSLRNMWLSCVDGMEDYTAKVASKAEHDAEHGLGPWHAEEQHRLDEARKAGIEHMVQCVRKPGPYTSIQAAKERLLQLYSHAPWVCYKNLTKLWVYKRGQPEAKLKMEFFNPETRQLAVLAEPLHREL